MPLTLHYHPLSSYCHKVLIALYENGTPFAPNLVNLGDPAQRAALLALYPIGKFPVLADEGRGVVVPESTVIIEYLARHYPGAVALVPQDAEAAAQVRAQDRFFDLYVHNPMQQVVGDRLRPADKRDPFGVAQARERIVTAYGMFEQVMSGQSWAAGETFTLADCAAAPALFYASRVQPFGPEHGRVAAYFERLKQRPSYARVLKEAEPYFHLFPKE